MDADLSFLTLAAPGEAEMRIKASRFLAVAAPVADEEEARAFLGERQRIHFDATHNCSAWRLRGGVWRANDAGEPSGSAGAPILAAIDGAGLADCIVVVTRYYGGTKLGVGGLIRAYGEAAAMALDAAPKRRGVPALRVRVRYGYAHTAAVMRAVERVEAVEVQHGFADGGSQGEVEFTLPEAQRAALDEQLRESTAGAVSFVVLGERIVFHPR